MKYTPRTNIRSDAPSTIVLPNHPRNVDEGVADPHYSKPISAPEVNPEGDRVFPSPKHREWRIAPPYDKSFKKVSLDREIKMTNYSVGTIDEKWSLASIPRFETKAETWGFNALCGVTKPDKYYPPIFMGFFPLTTRYTDNYDIIRAVDSFPAVEYNSFPDPVEIRRVLDELKAGVVNDSYSGFDALTELAELPETLGMLLSLFKAALRPIQGIKALIEKYEKAKRRGKTHSEAHGEIASAWMQYRYGIMPLVYSIQDALKLLDQAFDQFKTDRDFSVLVSKPLDRSKSTETHVAIYRAHEVRISVTAKSKYATFSDRLSDLITTNIFVTAWELIPMSFVIDWFINVGDIISSSTRGFADLSEERKFCYSIKRTTIDKHVLRWNFTDGVKRSYELTTSTPCSGNSDPLVYHFDNTSSNIGSAVLYERREESYERFTFTPGAPDLAFSPDLNWMRMLDGYVLSFNSISKTLKKFR